ncbi:sensor histidine kinase [Trueperella sp. LYQ143]|uniref:sensor histidine kinase n=1 Tax=Trueperella sp. LYQ143 TaxID=3391059 RepID=UPI0039839DCC
MSESTSDLAAIDKRPLDLVVVGADPLTAAIPLWLTPKLDGECHIHHATSFAELLAMESKLIELAVVTLTVDSAGIPPEHPIHTFLRNPAHDNVRIVILTSAKEVNGLNALADMGRLNLLGYLPDFPQKAFTRDIRSQMRRYRKNTRHAARQRHAAAAAHAGNPLLRWARRRHATTTSQTAPPAPASERSPNSTSSLTFPASQTQPLSSSPPPPMPPQPAPFAPATPVSSSYTEQLDSEPLSAEERFALNLDLSDLEIIHRIVDSADHLLGFQPRINFPPDVCLTREGLRVEEVVLALSGQVSLERASDAGDITMHHASTGRLIGMLAMTSGRPAFFTSRTTTHVVAVQLTFEQLNYIWNHDHDVPSLVAALFVRSFDRRLRRAEDIQIEQYELTTQLEQERHNLALALRNLEAARAELMSQARFASLGELAAGVAHELNNPMAAIDRTADHLLHAVESLIATCGDKKWARRTLAALEAAHDAPSLTTREARSVRHELENVVKDRAVAQRLVLAGIHDPEFAREITRSRHMSLETVELAASIGSGLRNLTTATDRITELVSSLRSYARPDGDPIVDIDVHVGIDDTLRLLSHRLTHITVDRDYHTLPRITCHPGQLSQVWTNLLTNAAEAMAEQSDAHITITTGRFSDTHISVKVADNGPGIPPTTQAHIFEPRFTTKNGQVRFGMGIGLSLVQNIVNRHEGKITVDSSPAGTTFTVILPIDGPGSCAGTEESTTAIHRFSPDPTESGHIPKITEEL